VIVCRKFAVVTAFSWHFPLRFSVAFRLRISWHFPHLENSVAGTEKDRHTPRMRGIQYAAAFRFYH
jgi:hypothetical protein